MNFITNKWTFRAALVAAIALAFVLSNRQLTLDANDLSFEKVTLSSLSQTLETSAITKPSVKQVINYPFDVKVADIKVSPKEMLNPGDVIASFDVSPWQAELSELEQTFNLEKIAVQKEMALWKNKNNQQYKLSQQQLSLIETYYGEKIDQLKTRIKNKDIIAHEAVLIEQIFAANGQQLSQGQSLFELAPVGNTYLELQLNDSIRPIGKRKLSVDIYSGGLNARPIKAKVDQKFDNSFGSLVAKATPETPVANELYNNVRAVVTYGNIKKTLKVQKGPYIKRGQNYVFIKQNDKLIKRAVTFGAENEYFIQIIDGLEEGDQVVVSDTTPYFQLKEVLIKG